MGRTRQRSLWRQRALVNGLGWSLGTTPDGGPGPVAVITPDSSILPTYYTAGNGYFPTSNTQNSYTGLSTYEGYEGHCVFFDGWQSTPDAYYRWDFGAGTETDEGGRYFVGVNAAHCFESAGVYDVVLTVTNQFGMTATDTVTVTIHAAGAGHTSMNVGTVNIPVTGTYALTTYYVDAVSGSDANDGKSEGAAWRTLAKVFAAIYKNNASAVSTWPVKPGDRILFKAGQTFNFSAAFSGGGYNFPAGITFGRYGAGANPLWQWVTPVGCLPWAPGTSYSVGDYFIAPSSAGYACRKVLQAYTSGAAYGDTETYGNNTGVILLPGFGLGFVGIFDTEINFWDSGGQSGVSSLGNFVSNVRNFALVRSTVRNQMNTVIGAGDNDGTPYTTETYGISSISSTYNQYDVSTWSVVLGFYGTFIGFALINNTFDKSGNHINYLTGVKHTVICDNVMSRPAFGRTAMRICGHHSVENGAHYNYVARNKFIGWIDPQSVDIFSGANGGGAHNGGGTRYNYSLVTFSPNGGTGMLTEDSIFEDNIITNYEVGLQLMNCKNIKVRNNLFVTPDVSTSTRDISIAGANNGLQMRPIDGLQIVNNTFARTGASPTGTIRPNIWFGDSTTTGGASTGGLHANVEIRNNLSVSRAGYNTALIEYQNAAQIAATTEDNNLLDSSGTYWAVVEGANVDFTTFKATYSKDNSSLKTAAGVVAPSSGVSHAPGYPDSAASNVAEADAYLAAYQLSSSSIAIDAGVTATNTWRDHLGVARPVGSGSDIGAFEYPTIVIPAVTGVLLEAAAGYLLLENADTLLVESGAAMETTDMSEATALTGSELIPVVQGGSTLSISVNDLKTFIEV